MKLTEIFDENKDVCFVHPHREAFLDEEDEHVDFDIDTLSDSEGKVFSEELVKTLNEFLNVFFKDSLITAYLVNRLYNNLEEDVRHGTLISVKGISVEKKSIAIIREAAVFFSDSVLSQGELGRGPSLGLSKEMKEHIGEYVSQWRYRFSGKRIHNPFSIIFPDNAFLMQGKYDHQVIAETQGDSFSGVAKPNGLLKDRGYHSLIPVSSDDLQEGKPLGFKTGSEAHHLIVSKALSEGLYVKFRGHKTVKQNRKKPILHLTNLQIVDPEDGSLFD